MCTHVQSVTSSAKTIFFAVRIERATIQQELSNQMFGIRSSCVNFPHLLKSYHNKVASLRGSAKLDEGNPRFSWSKACAEETLASYYMANDDDRYREPLHAALLHRIDWWQHSEGMGAWDFILYSCVSLALED